MKFKKEVEVEINMGELGCQLADGYSDDQAWFFRDFANRFFGPRSMNLEWSRRSGNANIQISYIVEDLAKSSNLEELEAVYSFVSTLHEHLAFAVHNRRERDGRSRSQESSGNTP
jgi:hypothetical protein